MSPTLEQAVNAGDKTGRLAMEHVGMDLGKRESQIAFLTKDGELIERRIRTERPRLDEFFGSRPADQDTFPQERIAELQGSLDYPPTGSRSRVMWIDDTRLRILAQERARQIKGYLIQNGKIPDEQLFIVDVELDRSADGDTVRADPKVHIK